MEEMSCADSSLLFRFRPSPCPTHYGERLATMPSADFCLITLRVTPAGAIGFHQVRSLQSMGSEEPRHLYTRVLLVSYRSLVKQISPDKNINCPCTAVSFTSARRIHGFVMLGSLTWRTGLT